MFGFKSKEEKLIENFGWKFKKKESDDIMWSKGDFLLTIYDEGWSFHKSEYVGSDISSGEDKITEEDLIKINLIIENA